MSFYRKLSIFCYATTPFLQGHSVIIKKVESILQHTFKNNAHVIEEAKEEVS